MASKALIEFKIAMCYKLIDQLMERIAEYQAELEK